MRQPAQTQIKREPLRGAWNRTTTFGLVLLCALLVSCTGPSGDGEVAAGEDARPPVELASTVDRAEAGVSDPITFRVTLDAAPGVSVSLPEVGSMIQGFRILDMGTEGPKQKEGRMWSREWFKLRADRTGSYLLPAVRAAYTEPDGSEGSAEAPQIFVEIKSTLDPEAEAQDIRDIKPMEKIEREFPRAWLIGGAAAILLIAALAAWFFFRRKRKEEAVRLLPPNERALMELDDLEATGILDEGRYREYVFNLSLIFRRFLERRYRITAVEQTSEEILSGLRRERILDEDLKQKTRSFLEETDPIKYSGIEPREEKTETLRTQLLTFLDISTPPEEPGTVMEQARGQ